MVGAVVVVQLAQQLAAPLTDGQGPDISRFDRIRGNPGVLFGLMHLMSFTAIYFGLA